MQPDAEVAGAEAEELAELGRLHLLELAEHERLGQRPRQAAQAAVQDRVELVVHQGLLRRLPR